MAKIIVNVIDNFTKYYVPIRFNWIIIPHESNVN